MEPRVSLITLAVSDLAIATAFYTALGWQRVSTEEGITVFDLIGQSLGLYPKAAMAQELGLPEAEIGTAGIVLSHNVRSKAEVGPLLARAEAAGATILKPAQDVFWGGHHGHFRDPDGHIWEIAWNPFAPLGASGEFRWNGYDNG